MSTMEYTGLDNLPSFWNFKLIVVTDFPTILYELYFLKVVDNPDLLTLYSWTDHRFYMDMDMNYAISMLK